MIDVCQAIFINKYSHVGAFFQAGIAGLAVPLVYIYFFIPDIRVVIPWQLTFQIGKDVIHFPTVSESNHVGVDSGNAINIIQCFPIMTGKVSPSEGLHAEDPKSFLRSLLDRFFHFFLRSQSGTLSDSQAAEIDKREEDIAFRQISSFFSHIHMMGRKTDGLDDSLAPGFQKAFPGTPAKLKISVVPDFMEKISGQFAGFKWARKQ